MSSCILFFQLFQRQWRPRTRHQIIEGQLPRPEQLCPALAKHVLLKSLRLPGKKITKLDFTINRTKHTGALPLHKLVDLGYAYHFTPATEVQRGNDVRQIVANRFMGKRVPLQPIPSATDHTIMNNNSPRYVAMVYFDFK